MKELSVLEAQYRAGSCAGDEALRKACASVRDQVQAQGGNVAYSFKVSQQEHGHKPTLFSKSLHINTFN